MIRKNVCIGLASLFIAIMMAFNPKPSQAELWGMRPDGVDWAKVWEKPAPATASTTTLPKLEWKNHYWTPLSSEHPVAPKLEMNVKDYKYRYLMNLLNESNRRRRQ